MKFKLDPKHLKPLTSAQRKRLQAVAWADRVVRQVYLEQTDGSQRLGDLLRRLARADESRHASKLMFSERPRKGWVAQAA